jgi:hypothetical protein
MHGAITVDCASISSLECEKLHGASHRMIQSHRVLLAHLEMYDTMSVCAALCPKPANSIRHTWLQMIGKDQACSWLCSSSAKQQ